MGWIYNRPDISRGSYISSESFFLIHLSVFEIRANINHHWIHTVNPNPSRALPPLSPRRRPLTLPPRRAIAAPAAAPWPTPRPDRRAWRRPRPTASAPWLTPCPATPQTASAPWPPPLASARCRPWSLPPRHGAPALLPALAGTGEDDVEKM